MHVAAYCNCPAVIAPDYKIVPKGVGPSTSSTESSTNYNMADNPEVTSEE